MSSLASAADISPTAKVEELTDFSGGLNTTIESHKLDPKFSPDLKNVFVHRKPGSVIRRNGYAVMGSTTGLMDGRFGYTFYHTTGSPEFIVSDSSRVYSTRDFATYVFVASNLVATANLDCAQGRDRVLCTDGYTTPFTWDGATRQYLTWAPKRKYVEYWQDRFWLFASTSDATVLNYSILITTAAEIITPFDPRAFPGSAELFVGRGDGGNGTGMWVQNGRLFMGKDNSIWRIVGNDPTTYLPDIVDKETGVISNDSIAVGDGVAYFKGLEGAYEFDGQVARRITDGIVPDMDAVNNAILDITRYSWDTQTDLSPGNQTNTTVTFRNGQDVVEIITGTYRATFRPVIVTGGQVLSLTGTTFFMDTMITTAAIPYNFNGSVRGIEFNLEILNDPTCGCGGAGTYTNTTKFTIRNTITQSSHTAQFTNTGCGSSHVESVDFSQANTNHIITSGSVINATTPVQGITIQYNIIDTGSTEGNCAARIYGSSQTNTDFIAYTTAQYLSQIATITDLATWDRFNTLINLNNAGTIDFFIRTATDPVNISTQVWTSIANGSLVDQPTRNKYVQWASTFVATGGPALPYVDRVSIDYFNALLKDRPFSIYWNREWWLSIATGSNNTSIQYVKAWQNHSNPYAWNRLNNMEIRSLFKDGDRALYAGSASTGTFFKIDFGSNDMGLPIFHYYDTPDYIFGNNFTEKQLLEVWLDADRGSNKNFELGISTDNASFAYRNIAFNGVGRGTKFAKGFTGKSNTFRFKFQNIQKDQSLNLHNALILYVPTEIRSER